MLLPDPCYPVFMTGMRLGGGVPYFYPLTQENNFLPDVRAIPEDVARKARLMLVSLPANPVGSIGTPELYAEIVAFCKKYNILLVHDNAYSDIIFDGAHGGSVFNTPGAEEVAVEFFSLSKSFNVTGARISFLVGRPDVVAACKKLRTQIDFGMFYPIQRAAIAALTARSTASGRSAGVYQARRDALCGGAAGHRLAGAGQPRQHVRVGAAARGLAAQHGVLPAPHRRRGRHLHAGRELWPFRRRLRPFCPHPARRDHPKSRRRHRRQRHSGGKGSVTPPQMAARARRELSPSAGADSISARKFLPRRKVPRPTGKAQPCAITNLCRGRCSHCGPQARFRRPKAVRPGS